MKIQKVIGYGLSSPVKGGHTYYGYQSDTKNIGVIEVHTDNGLIGYGETYAGVYCAELIEPTVKYLEPFLIGLEVKNANIDSIPFIARSGLLRSVFSGIDIALYDILSQDKNQALYEYVSPDGDYKFVDTYASNGSATFTPKQIEDDVKNILDLGYQSYKMRIGIQDKTTDLLRLEAAKKLLGSNNLMVDAIMGTNPNKWNYDTALKWSEDLEQFDVYWLEEPFNPIQVYNYSKLRMNSKISIAGGEALNQSLEFDLYKATAAVDIIQPDVTNSGGISDCKTIVSMFGKENVAMHVWGSQIAINANEHFARALGVKFLEKPMMELTINEEIICDGPGLGIKITDNIKSKYKLKPKENFKI